MVDSQQLCSEWLAALNHNQNSGTLGPVGEDGLWRDKDGNVVQSSGGYGAYPCSSITRHRRLMSLLQEDRWRLLRVCSTL